MVTVKVSDLLKKAQELVEDGIEYVEIGENEADMDLPKFLTFYGYEGFGVMIDYEDLDHIDVSVNYKCNQCQKP